MGIITLLISCEKLAQYLRQSLNEKQHALAQYLRQSLNEKQHAWLASHNVEVYYIHSNFARLLCELLGTVWTYCCGDNSHYIITSLANYLILM